MVEAIVLDILAFYAAMGVLTAILFVSFGVSRVLGHGATATIGARLLWLPPAAALWPYVLVRWLTWRGVR